jgi:acid phosphatase type 7
MSRIVVAATLVGVVVAGGLYVSVVAGDRSTAPPRQVPNHAFPSLPSGRPATLWAVGDGADGGRDARAVARRIAAGRPDRVLYLGDVYPDGTARDFARGFQPVYGRLARRIAPTPGNHDWPNHETGYDPYWRNVTGAPTPPWYAFRAGGWRVLVLNSEAPHGAGSAQLSWLRSRVRGRTTCRLAVWHRPRFSAGPHGDQADVAPFWDALRGHAKLVLSGHDHDLQRLKPSDGLTQVVSGAGGHGRYELEHGDPRLAFGDDEHYGALRLRLHPGRASLAFVAVDGRVLDQSKVRCRPAR